LGPFFIYCKSNSTNFRPKAGPKLARQYKKTPTVSRKCLTCFAPQPGLEPMRALKNDPVNHFSEAVRLQRGRFKPHYKLKTGHRPAFEVQAKQLINITNSANLQEISVNSQP